MARCAACSRDSPENPRPAAVDERRELDALAAVAAAVVLVRARRRVAYASTPVRAFRRPLVVRTMPRKPKDGLYSKLHLVVTAKTQLGQSVFVSGSSSGDRSLEGRGEALEMVTSPKEWPVWRTKKPIIIARGVAHEYEYTVRSGDDVESEAALEGYFPRIVVPQAPEVHLEDVFGVFDGGGPGDRTSSFASSRFGSASELAGVKHRLHIVCYHLPVRVSKDEATGEWRASWGDSLIARSDDGSYADEVETWWVGTVHGRAGKGCENPNFKGSYLGRFPLVSADFWTGDHLSERSRSANVFFFFLERARAERPR